MDDEWLVESADLDLTFRHPLPERRLAFGRFGEPPEAWREKCREALAELLGIPGDAPDGPSGPVEFIKRRCEGDVLIEAWVMGVEEGLSIPGYLLTPIDSTAKGAVMAIHGHGEVGPCLGTRDDYHHAFALRLAQAGYLVLCPELRGFGALRDLAAQSEGDRIDYWNWGRHMAYSLVTDGLVHGRTLIGDTVRDLLRWEAWLAETRHVRAIDVAGISYGGDLALIYPVFTPRVRGIFASGTLGSFSVIFSRCYNAPAHCIPGVLKWMDRADVAGLNAPRPIVLHYGELDRPGRGNYSASYNETVPKAVRELRTIYRAFGAEDAVRLVISRGKQHEMDIEALLTFLNALGSEDFNIRT